MVEGEGLWPLVMDGVEDAFAFGVAESVAGVLGGDDVALEVAGLG